MIFLWNTLNPQLDAHLNKNFIFEIVIDHFLVLKLGLDLILKVETYWLNFLSIHFFPIRVEKVLSIFWLFLFWLGIKVNYVTTRLD